MDKNLHYYKDSHGAIATKATLNLPEIDKIEFDQYYEKSIETQALQASAAKKHRPLSQSEVLSMFLSQNIQSIQVDDATAVRMRDFYPEWTSLIGKEVDQGFKFTYNNDLYRTLTKHTFAEHWVPGDGTESLYELIPEYFAGDEYDPIPYKGNMRLELGKYYIQDNIMYKCIRDTGIAVFDSLAKLETIEGGQFVEKIL